MIRTMDLKIKERVVIEFIAKKDCVPKEIPNCLKDACRDAVMNIKNVRDL